MSSASIRDEPRGSTPLLKMKRRFAVNLEYKKKGMFMHSSLASSAVFDYSITAVKT